MRLQASIYLVVVCAVCAGLAWLIATFAVTSVERDTVTRIETSFQAAGIDWATSEANGLQIFLSGTAESESSRVRMLETVAQVVNTSRLVDTTKVERKVVSTVPDFKLEILRHNRDLSLIGLIPGSDARIEVLRAFSDIRDPNSFSDFMEAVDYPAPDGWAEALKFALSNALTLDRSHFVVRPGGVEIEAFLPSQSEKDALRAKLEARTPEGMAVKLDLRAPKAVVSPFTFAAELAGSELNVSACNSDTEEAKLRIYSALSDFGTETDCDLALGSVSDTWSDAVAGVLASLSRMSGGSVRIEDTDITLTAPLGMDETAFSIEETKLRGLLPDAFSLSAILPSKPKPRETVEIIPPELKAVLTEDGQLELSVPMRNELAAEATRNFAAARFGNGRVNADIRVDDTLPEGWAGRALAVLDALSMLNAGEASLDETSANIFGVTAEPEGAAIVSTFLGDRLDGVPLTADVVFDESLVVTETVVVLSDRECERALSAIMREFQITFAPSSAQIDGASEPVIDEIGEVLKTCPDAPIEIGGHTDSQGRESMNLGLSQARAEAVLDALLARDVLLGSFSAKGYGEAEPIADNDTAEGRAANRRIAFKLIEEEAVETPEDPADDEGAGDEQN